MFYYKSGVFLPYPAISTMKFNMFLILCSVSARRDVNIGKPSNATKNESLPEPPGNKTIAICSGMSDNPQTVCDYELQAGGAQTTYFDTLKVLVLLFFTQ